MAVCGSVYMPYYVHFKDFGIRLKLLSSVVRYRYRVAGHKYTSLSDVSATNTCARFV